MKNLPSFITKVSTVIMAITAVDVQDAASCWTQELPSITYHATVWPGRSKQTQKIRTKLHHRTGLPFKTLDTDTFHSVFLSTG